MNSMFKNTLRFNADISQWNVQNCYNMEEMFYSARKFNQDISQWETNKLAYMKGMFQNAIAFKTDLSAWNLSLVHDIKRMNAFEDNVFFNSAMETSIIKQFYINHKHMYRKRIKIENEENIVYLYPQPLETDEAEP